MEKFKEAYNAGLANGIGNLTSRIVTLSEKHILKRVPESVVEDVKNRGMSPFIKDALDNFNIHLACQIIWEHISKLDQQIASEEVFKVIKIDNEKGLKLLTNYLEKLAIIAFELEPILPKTSAKIIGALMTNTKPVEPLFMRK
jgi:methionyl-tRNA synthetase